MPTEEQIAKIIEQQYSLLYIEGPGWGSETWQRKAARQIMGLYDGRPDDTASALRVLQQIA